eukprot:gb/GFBE01006027.1/.p1 GENE.gb/GFBE01006027.1/~~gb/GFBE01006027.1/.p1  ORF type:complete len:121 (+),score=12.60 gb/GFBE01006027.1/:1-363(+)
MLNHIVDDLGPGTPALCPRGSAEPSAIIFECYHRRLHAVFDASISVRCFSLRRSTDFMQSPHKPMLQACAVGHARIGSDSGKRVLQVSQVQLSPLQAVQLSMGQVEASWPHGPRTYNEPL